MVPRAEYTVADFPWMGYYSNLAGFKAMDFCFTILCSSIPLAFIVKTQPQSFVHYSMGVLPFWIFAVCKGIEGLLEYLAQKSRIKELLPGLHSHQILVMLLIILIMPWTPQLLDNIRYPKQNYKELFKTYTKDFPEAKTLFGASIRFYTGLSYYARTFGLNYYVINSLEEAADSLLESNSTRGLVVLPEFDTDPAILEWVDNNMVLYCDWKGILPPPTKLYIPAK